MKNSENVLTITLETKQKTNLIESSLGWDEFQLLNSKLKCRFLQTFDDIMKKDVIERMLLSINVKENFKKLMQGKSILEFDTHDNKLTLKSISEKNMKVIEKNLELYISYQKYTNSLMAKIYGVFSIHLQKSKEVLNFILLENSSQCLPKDILNVYQLKGTKIKKLKEGELVPYFLKKQLGDYDFLNQEAELKIPNDIKAPLLKQICNDVQFFEQLNLVNYSMILYKVDISDIALLPKVFPFNEGVESNDQNLKQIKFDGFNIELRDIYWHVSLTDFFQNDSESKSKQYAQNFIDFFRKIIKDKENEEDQETDLE